MSDLHENPPPIVSVVMSVYNAEETIDDAIKSILGQTLEDYELILIDDGSTDRTRQILEEYADKESRIRVISHKNIGLTRSLNRGLQEAKGKYIARQDADDYSYPQRLAMQVELMENNPDIVLCGSNCDNVYSDGITSQWGHKTEEVLKSSIPYKTPFAHSTAIFKTDSARKLGGYDETFVTAQDMEFWIRLSAQGRVVMLEQPLIKRHVLDNSVSVKKRWRQNYDAFRARWKHNRNNRVLALYHTLRSFLISLLPAKVLAFKQGLKNE
jgi:glycosyltransferase involved in cell wall biosynthesis